MIAKSCSRLANEFEQHFFEHILRCWFPRCIDKAGGFVSDFGDNWVREPAQEKWNIFESRLTWTAATISIRYDDLSEEFAAYARHGGDSLEGLMWDPKRGGSYLGRLENGLPRDPDIRLTYNDSFSLFGLSAAFAATKDSRFLTRAQDIFHWIDTVCRDRENGGYFEWFSHLPQASSSASQWQVAQRPDHATKDSTYLIGLKTSALHLHLVESFTELFKVWDDALLRARLHELLTMICDRFSTPLGFHYPLFTADWKPMPDAISIGHNFEAAFLMGQALETLGTTGHLRNRVLAAIERLVFISTTWGIDKLHGGMLDKFSADGDAYDQNKIWWVQAEAISALAMAVVLFPEKREMYFDKLEMVWRFIQTHMVDKKNGEWWAMVSQDGQPLSWKGRSERTKAWFFKDCYHTARALIFASTSLRLVRG